MSRTFRPKLIPTIAMLIGLGILLGLGTWQYNRFNEKLVREAELATQSKLPAVALDTLPIANPDALTELNYRTITLTGQLDMSHAVLFKHRQYEHRPGYWLAAPLILNDGKAVWTNLGWLPFDKGDELARELAATPTQKKAYTGLFYILPQNISDTRTRGALDRGDITGLASTFTQWHTYDIGALLELTPHTMGDTPAVLVLDESHSGDPFPLASTDTITQPYMTAERHKGYFLFWYSTAGALVLLWLGASLGLIGSFGRRRASTEEITGASP